MSQRDKIYDLLEKRGSEGVYNYELNKIAFRYGARIHELRKEGLRITSKYIKKGVFKFTLEEEDE